MGMRLRSGRAAWVWPACLIVLLPLAARPQTVDFESGRWNVTAGRVEEFLGRRAFLGTAFLPDVQFENGTIEVDIAVSADRLRSYPGILFRVVEGQNWERFYIRPHRHSLYADTLQYLPAFNGVDSWQLYSGPGYTALASIPINEWFRVRIEVWGRQARVFLGDAAEPALLIPRLEHGSSRGSLGVNGPLDGTAYFSNFSFRPAEGPLFESIPLPETTPGAFMDWQVSRPYRALDLDLEKTPEDQSLGDLGWTPLGARPDGLVDISRLHRRSGEPDLVFARTILRAEREESRKVDFGYSDIVSVFLNGRLLHQANSQYQGRDSSFLGVAGYFDSLHLPLKKGDNELLLAVTEVSGGWGFMVRDGAAFFAIEGLREKWVTPRSLSIPESVVYDETRNCLYVSNYDGYKPSRAEGRQSITKVAMDGTIESPDWVTGLRNPTGLCIVGDRLWAVERGGVVEIDVPSAKILNRIVLAGALMPNDIAAAEDGSLYVTDSGRSMIYKVAGGKAEEWLAGPQIGRPNGICVDGPSLIVGTNLDGCVKSIELSTKNVKVIVRLGAGIIDGIQALPMGRYLVSHNEGRLYRVTQEGTAAKVLDLTVVGRNIADFAYLRSRALLVFPSFTDNRLTAYAAPMPVFMSYRTPEEIDHNDRLRDERFQIDRGLDGAGIEPGMTVGEVGAGEGYLVFKLADRVGLRGRVLAEDIFDKPLETLRRRAGERGLANIETILGQAEDPGFPPGALDMVFMHATIKFVKDPVTLFRNIVPGLKRGGRIIVLEPERHNACDLDGRPVPESFRTREEYLKMFEDAGLKVDRIDDATLPCTTVFVLSAR